MKDNKDYDKGNQTKVLASMIYNILSGESLRRQEEQENKCGHKENGHLDFHEDKIRCVCPHCLSPIYVEKN